MHLALALTNGSQPEAAAEALLRRLGPPGKSRRAVLLYATAPHGLAGPRRHLAGGPGPEVVPAGGSTQGVVGPGAARGGDPERWSILAAG